VYWKRRLPHWIPDGAIIFVTWRLHGDARWLCDPRLAKVIVDALLCGSRHRYDLHAWVVMPTHAHVVMTPKRPFSEITRWLKWTTARRCNQLLNRNGIFWQDESFDH
jgi:REP element-mobilizing transposase RayT